MPDQNDFLVKVTADISEASAGFDELLKTIDDTASRAQQGLSQFDRLMRSSGGSILQLAAQMTPVGRSLS